MVMFLDQIDLFSECRRLDLGGGSSQYALERGLVLFSRFGIVAELYRIRQEHARLERPGWVR